MGGVVIYPVGLNGGSEPVQITLPKLPLWEEKSTSKDTQLQITLPTTTQGDSPGAIPLWLLTLVSSPHSITECPSEVFTGPSMMEEIEELLLNPMFEMPGESSMCNSPRRPPLTDLPNPMASKEENPHNPGEALLGYLKQPLPSPHKSSQVDMADIMAHSSHSLSHSTLERDTSPTPFLLWANFILLHYHIGQDVMPCPGMSMYALLQRQLGSGSGEAYLNMLGYWANLSGVIPHSTSDFSYWSLNPGHA